MSGRRTRRDQAGLPVATFDEIGSDSTAVLALREVTRTYGSGELAVHALAGIILSVAAGELVAIMGPSGSGKSSLLAIAGGLDRPGSGDVLLSGESLLNMSARQLAAVRRRSIGYVFQRLNLIPSLTAAENVMLPRELDGIPTRQARALSLIHI